MRLLLWGIDHRSAAVQLREKIALTGDRLEAFRRQLQAAYPQVECVVLSTCNRTEIYLARPTHEPPDFQQVTELVASITGATCKDMQAAVVQREKEEVITHLFGVASGLDSMVLGEVQVLGQVRRAYTDAAECGMVGPTLHRVFQQAIATAKEVRNQTGIDRGRRSIGSVAVDFARQVFDGFSDKTMLAIGAGEMAKLTLVHLRDLKPHRLWITNRTDERARQLAIDLCLEQPHGVRKFEDLDDLLVEADIVLTATSAAEPILTTERFRSIMKRRRSRPVFIVDIALPRDVEAGVGQLSNVYLYNLDDLQKVIGINNQERDSQAQEAHQLVQEAACLCMSQLQNQDIGRLIRSLRERLQTYGEGEQARTLAKLQSISDAELRELLPELLAEHNHRLINKVLHLPLSQLDRKQPNRTLAFHATALRKLFDLPDGTEDAKVENRVEPVPPKEVIHP